MKNILFLTLLICSTICFGQDFIYQQKTNLKTGIYKTFEEFKTNSPSIPLKLTFSAESVHYKDRNREGWIFRSRIVSKRKQFKTIDRIYGFCNGTSVFINTAYPLGQRPSKLIQFYKVIHFGEYIYFESPFYTSEGYGTMSYRYRTAKKQVIHLTTGTLYNLNSRTLSRILKPHPNLHNQFKVEQNKEAVLVDYIIKLNEKLN